MANTFWVMLISLAVGAYIGYVLDFRDEQNTLLYKLNRRNRMLGVVVGTIGKLEGITRHGKNRVRERGSEVKVLRIWNRVAFSDKEGTWLDVETLDGKHSRWIHATDWRD